MRKLKMIEKEKEEDNKLSHKLKHSHIHSLSQKHTRITCSSKAEKPKQKLQFKKNVIKRQNVNNGKKLSQLKIKLSQLDSF